MAAYTTYKNLEKPDASELYNINVANKNNDIIDSELHKLELKSQSQDNLFATKESLNEHILSKNNPHGITKSQLGLSNVNNTSDIDKPVSTAQQEAIDTALAQSNYYTDAKLADLIDGAPETLDTLKEVADAIAENETVVELLNAAIGTKANQTELDTHTNNNVIHITQDDKDNWNDANLKKHLHDNQTVLDGITSALVTEWNHSVTHVSDSLKHITSEERTAWNAANTHAASSHAPSDAERNIIAGIQKNGVDLPVSEDRKVNIDIPTGLSSFDNDSRYVSEQEMEELLSDYSSTEQVQQLIDQSLSQIPDGRDGLSAYEIALSHGFSGTEEEWVMSLNGKDGVDGKTPTIGENSNWFIGSFDTEMPSRGEKGEKGDKGDSGEQGIRGDNGNDGFSPVIIENVDNSLGIYKLDITTKDGSFTTPNLRGSDSDVSTEYVQELIQETTSGAKIAQNEKGEWGYIPAGADAVIPFKSSVSDIGGSVQLNYLKLGTTTSNFIGTLWFEKDADEVISEEINTTAVLSTVSSELENSISCTDGGKYLIGDIFLNTKDTGEVGCCWIE